MPKTKTSLSDILPQIPVFSKLTQRQRADSSDLALWKWYAEGEFLAHQGDVWPYILILAEGLINVHKLSPEGRSLGAWRIGGGEVFWSPSVFDDGPLPATLEVRQPSQVYLWHWEQLLPIVRLNPEAIWELCELLTQRIRQASEMVEDLAFQPVANRLARLLMKQYEETADIHMSRSLTLDEMATMIGTTPVMVCKILSKFTGEGIINVSRTEFEIIEYKKLEQMAKPCN
ncbi:MAG: Crp/Fnr family transcriptional regulator [Anaerolineales bacterium]|nr:Crp/Fnr family transcriptional regulator [Chloroflexota bacterium]MBL6979610.1 Crp/Fnr family transcriptional regulator [Anaerolineales bacterium]